MSIFTRLSDVLRANINALIDRAEDPEKMANQIIIDLERVQDDVTVQVANSIAEEKRLKAQVAHTNGEIDRWENRAMAALRQNQEDLAREAVRQKQRFESDANLYQDHHRQQVELVDGLKNSLRQLNLKLEEARRRRDQLIARTKNAQAQAMMAKTMNKMNPNSALGALERMEKKVRTQEGLAEAYVEMNQAQDIEGKFRDMENKKSIEDELAVLKAKLGQE